MLGYNIDIVMCLDATGAMVGFFQELEYYTMDFYNKFAAVMEADGIKVDTLRIKVVAFKDYMRDCDPMHESEFFEFPKESAEFKRFLESIDVRGGGDIPEDSLEALTFALRSNWTTAPGKNRHIILLFTDAPAHPLGYSKDSCSYPENMPKSLDEIRAWWEGTQECGSNYNPTDGRMVVFAPNAEPWIEMQEWDRYWYVNASDAGCLDIDMDIIINMLRGVI